MRTARLATAVVALVTFAACAAAEPNLLGGRERCWDEAADPKLETLMRGTLELDPSGSVLHTPEGERFALNFPLLAVRTASGTMSVVDGSGTAVATHGELVTVFGGLGADRVIQVCAIEERHDG